VVSVCRPGFAWPDHQVTQPEMITALQAAHGLDDDDRRLEVMRRAGVATRRMIRPIADMLAGDSFDRRNQLYAHHAVALGAEAARAALRNAHAEPEEIDALVVVSCTGYMLPGPDAHIAGLLGLRPTIKRVPITQHGCAAGGSALAAAFEYVLAHRVRREAPAMASVLVVAVELCSLSYQPAQTSVSDFISAGLFGDGAAAAVVRGNDWAAPLPAVRLLDARQHLLPDSTEVIAGTTGASGLHFATNPWVRSTIPRIIPAVRHFLAWHGVTPHDLGFVVCHTGGPAILQAVAAGLELAPGMLAPSWASLAEVGNVSSVVIFDVLRRWMDAAAPPSPGALGLILAFGPGFTTEMLLCRWNEP
jgi:1,3,6,8-tetrahydroxynaphthalene synthase